MDKEEKECKLYYKAFNDDLTCRGIQYEVGKTYHLEKGTELEMCKRGFHCCELALNCLEYYGRNSVFVKFKLDRTILHKTEKQLQTP